MEPLGAIPQALDPLARLPVLVLVLVVVLQLWRRRRLLVLSIPMLTAAVGPGDAAAVARCHSLVPPPADAPPHVACAPRRQWVLPVIAYNIGCEHRRLAFPPTTLRPRASSLFCLTSFHSARRNRCELVMCNTWHWLTYAGPYAQGKVKEQKLNKDNQCELCTAGFAHVVCTCGRTDTCATALWLRHGKRHPCLRSVLWNCVLMALPCSTLSGGDRRPHAGGGRAVQEGRHVVVDQRQPAARDLLHHVSTLGIAVVPQPRGD